MPVILTEGLETTWGLRDEIAESRFMATSATLYLVFQTNVWFGGRFDHVGCMLERGGKMGVTEKGHAVKQD